MEIDETAVTLSWEDAYRNRISELVDERDKYKLALEHIRKHVELSVGTVAKYSAVYHIANKALKDNQ